MSSEPPNYPYGPSVGGPPVPMPQQRQSNVLSIVSFVLAAISILFAPIIFGVIAIILAGIGISRGEPLSRIAIVVAPVCMIAGIVLAYVVLKSQGVI